MLNFQCRQPNGATMARTLNLVLMLGHPIFTFVIKCHEQGMRARSCSLMVTHRLYV